MAQEQIVAYSVDVTDWNDIRQKQTHIPQNWNVKNHGPLNADNLKKFLEEQWGDMAMVHSVTEVKAEINKEAFLANRGSAEARPTIINES